MKLLELFDSKPRAADEWMRVINDLIGKHSLEEFQGGQARVITSKDRKYVYRFWSRDPGYEKWLKVALTMQDNPHVVKVLSKVKSLPARASVNTRFVKLEKLTKITDRDVRNAIGVLHEVISRISRPDLQKITPKEFQEFVLGEMPNDSFMTLTAGGRAVIERETKFVETYLEFLKLDYNDMYDENIMMRGDVIVICDPLLDFGDF